MDISDTILSGAKAGVWTLFGINIAQRIHKIYKSLGKHKSKFSSGKVEKGRRNVDKTWRCSNVEIEAFAVKKFVKKEATYLEVEDKIQENNLEKVKLENHENYSDDEIAMEPEYQDIVKKVEMNCEKVVIAIDSKEDAIVKDKVDYLEKLKDSLGIDIIKENVQVPNIKINGETVNQEVDVEKDGVDSVDSWASTARNRSPPRDEDLPDFDPAKFKPGYVPKTVKKGEDEYVIVVSGVADTGLCGKYWGGLTNLPSRRRTGAPCAKGKPTKSEIQKVKEYEAIDEMKKDVVEIEEDVGDKKRPLIVEKEEREEANEYSLELGLIDTFIDESIWEQGLASKYLGNHHKRSEVNLIKLNIPGVSLVTGNEAVDIKNWKNKESTMKSSKQLPLKKDIPTQNDNKIT